MLHLKNFFAGLRPTGIMAVNNVMFLFFVGGAQALKAAGGGHTYREINLAPPLHACVNFLKRVRSVPAMSQASTCAVDDRRWQWLTSSNLTTWFEGYKKALFDAGFIDRLPDDPFEVLAIDPRRAARMVRLAPHCTYRATTPQA